MRPDLLTVAGLVPASSRVLDLGCGEGALLDHLISVKGCTGAGVEIDRDSVLAAIRRGVSVIELDIDSQLGEFADSSYDMVVLSRTLQATRRPDEVLREISRIGHQCIVSVPNFGWWKHRLGLLTTGRMPVSRELPHSWYETPNIHLSTLVDLEMLIATANLSVEKRVLLADSGRILKDRGSGNLRAGAAIYVLRSLTSREA